jgi:DNA-binding PadR family transcriptional regulator
VLLHTEHSFNIKLAELVGIEKAILLKNIHWWIVKNAKNHKNFRDGRYWTYNSSKAFGELFPYMSEGSIRRWLIELEDENWIVTNNFNRRKNDKTKWYSIGNTLRAFCEVNNLELDVYEKTVVQNERVNNEPELFTVQNGQRNVQIEQSIVQNEQSVVQNERTLPDINTDKKHVVEVVVSGEELGNRDNGERKTERLGEEANKVRSRKKEWERGNE